MFSVEISEYPIILSRSNFTSYNVIYLAFETIFKNYQKNIIWPEAVTRGNVCHVTGMLLLAMSLATYCLQYWMLTCFYLPKWNAP